MVMHGSAQASSDPLRSARRLKAVSEVTRCQPPAVVSKQVIECSWMKLAMRQRQAEGQVAGRHGTASRNNPAWGILVGRRGSMAGHQGCRHQARSESRIRAEAGLAGFR